MMAAPLRTAPSLQHPLAITCLLVYLSQKALKTAIIKMLNLWFESSSSLLSTEAVGFCACRAPGN
jgi:hypothetical protein